MKTTAVTVMVLFSAALVSAQSQRWEYTYDGPAGQWDQAWQVRCGPDSGVYVCGDGQATAIPLTFEMTLAALTMNGDERWFYRYTGPGSRLGQAYSLALTPDRSIVVAGATWDIVTANDFAVLGVSDSGTHRWAYRIADSGVGLARAVVSDHDGNSFACGTTHDYERFTVASLTPAGAERWLWPDFDLPGEAMAIALDSGGLVYAAGYLTQRDSTQNFSVWQLALPDSAQGVILTTRSRDTAIAVSVGIDGNVYAAGHMDTDSTGPDIAVVSIDTGPLSPRWLYTYDYAGGMDHAQAMLCGNDGNIYVAGYGFLPESSGVAFIVLSVTADGDLRWAFADTGAHAAALNVAAGLAQDAVGNIYACGQLAGSESTRMDAAVISLTPQGAERWRYLYAGPDTVGDNFGSIALGPDGNLYACGTTGDPPNADWLVVSLTESGVAIGLRTPQAELSAQAPTFFHDRIAVRVSPALARSLDVRLYDAAGRIVARQTFTPKGGYVTFGGRELARLAPGCYFLDLGSGLSRLKLMKP